MVKILSLEWQNCGFECRARDRFLVIYITPGTHGTHWGVVTMVTSVEQSGCCQRSPYEMVPRSQLDWFLQGAVSRAVKIDRPLLHTAYWRLLQLGQSPTCRVKCHVTLPPPGGRFHRRLPTTPHQRALLRGWFPHRVWVLCWGAVDVQSWPLSTLAWQPSSWYFVVQY